MDIKKRIAEIDEEIAKLQAERALLLEEEVKVNPYAHLKTLSNKSFGEGWSEPWVASKCPSMIQDRHAGYDFSTIGLGRVELKSTRLPLKKITYNQCHPHDCDYFLFIDYDTVNGTEDIYLMPSEDLSLIHPSIQHERKSAEEGECFSVTGSSCKRNAKILKKYKLNSWDELEKRAKG